MLQLLVFISLSLVSLFILFYRRLYDPSSGKIFTDVSAKTRDAIAEEMSDGLRCRHRSASKFSWPSSSIYEDRFSMKTWPIHVWIYMKWLLTGKGVLFTWRGLEMHWGIEKIGENNTCMFASRFWTKCLKEFRCYIKRRIRVKIVEIIDVEKLNTCWKSTNFVNFYLPEMMQCASRCLR